MKKTCMKAFSKAAFPALLCLFVLQPTVAHAEYRVFTLIIQNAQTKEIRTVTSTLDPLQYPSYYPLNPDEKVSYTETWRCFGRTGDFAAYCPNPKAQPASENAPPNP
jgi:hypothetical protein